jgi:hypothetical protein
MANTQPYEIIAGPLDVYVAPAGTAAPSLAETPGTEWRPLGLTEGGIKVSLPQTIVELRADQVTGVVKAVRSEEACEFTFDLASLTLENFSIALNKAFVGGSDGHAVSLYRGGFQVQTLALLAKNDHLSPYGDSRLQFHVPHCFQAGAPEAAFSKDAKAVLATSWHTLVNPDRTEDEDETFFGTLEAT